MKTKKKLSYVIVWSLLIVSVSSWRLHGDRLEDFHGETLGVSEKVFWAGKVTADSQAHVILLGDSRVAIGLSPTIIEKKLDAQKKVHNFAFPNNQMNKAYYAMVNELFVRQDKTIVVGLSPQAFSSVAHDQKFKEAFKEHRSDRYLRTCFPWLYSQTEAVSLTDLAQRVGFLENKNNKDIRYGNHGTWFFKLKKENLRYYEKSLQGYMNVQFEDKLFEDFCRQIKSWVKEGATVICYRAPVNSFTYDIEKTKLQFNVEEVKSGVVQSGARWIELDSDDYDYSDGSHTTPESTIRLSEDMASELLKLWR